MAGAISATPSRASVFFAAYPGERVVLGGTGIDTSGFAIDSDTSLDGFAIRNFEDFGVIAWRTNDHLYYSPFRQDCVLQASFLSIADPCGPLCLAESS